MTENTRIIRLKAQSRVANFLIAALCYLLLFIFIFNVKAAVVEFEESGHVLFASAEINNENKITQNETKLDKISPNPTSNQTNNKILPPKPKLIKTVQNIILPAKDFIPVSPSVSTLSSLNLPQDLEVGNETANNVGGSETKGSELTENIVKSGAPNANENNKNEKDAAKFQYIEKIIARIERKKSYPLRARELKMEGVVIIGMKISRNGMLSGVRIIKSSKIQMLDDAALNAVKNAAPFDKFPPLIDNDSLSIETPIEFELKV
jgi:protein TonB